MSRTTGQRTTGVRAMGSLLATAFALAVATQAGAECQGGQNIAVPEATPSEDFFDFGDGTVLHRPTQLVWLRCAVGQSWTGKGCSGTADSLDWAAALVLAKGFEFAGAMDWRVPNRNELASIIETRCHGPAINGAVFPDSPAGAFWTASPVTSQADAVWVIEFGQGALRPEAAGGSGTLRLVRGGRM